MSDMKTQPTEAQRTTLDLLRQNFDLSASDVDRCLFFSRDQEVPFIPTEILIRLARSTDTFASIEPEFDTHVPELNQLIYKGRVIDKHGREIVRIGVATIGEQPGGYEIDPHTLAESRAIGKALTDQGFNPLKSGSVVIGKTAPKNDRPPEYSGQPIDPAARRRRDDLGLIHITAVEKGLITHSLNGPKDMTKYRSWMRQNFGSETAATLSETERSQVINKLRLYPEDESFQSLPVEFREDALIA